MTFKAGDLVCYRRETYRPTILALVVDVKAYSHRPLTPRIRIQWLKSGRKAWEWADAFEKVSK